MNIKKLLCLLFCIPLLSVSFSLSGCRTDAKQIVNVYALCGTLPTLYAGLNIAKYRNESHLYFLRDGTLNLEKLPAHVKTKVTGDDASNIETINTVIQDLYEKNPEVHINLFCDDLRVQWELQMLVMNKIKNYSVTLLSDGTASYGKLFTSLYKAADTYPVFARNADIYDTKKQLALDGEDPGLSWGPAPMELETAALYASQSDKFKYWLQFPELLSSQDPLITEQVNKAHTLKIQPNDLYAALSAQQKNEFLSFINLDKTYFDELFSANRKPNLIIAGASINSSGQFTALIQKVIDLYG